MISTHLMTSRGKGYKMSGTWQGEASLYAAYY
jgi:hypothetical protein